MRKEYHCQAFDENGNKTFDAIVNTRAKQKEMLQEALKWCRDGNAVYMRSQTIGARGWAVFALQGDCLVQKFKAEADEIERIFK